MDKKKQPLLSSTKISHREVTWESLQVTFRLHDLAFISHPSAHMDGAMLSVQNSFLSPFLVPFLLAPAVLPLFLLPLAPGRH